MDIKGYLEKPTITNICNEKFRSKSTDHLQPYNEVCYTPCSILIRQASLGSGTMVACHDDIRAPPITSPGSHPGTVSGHDFASLNGLPQDRVTFLPMRMHGNRPSQLQSQIQLQTHVITLASYGLSPYIMQGTYLFPNSTKRPAEISMI